MRSGPSYWGQNAGAAIPMRHAEGRGAYINVGGQGPFLEAGARRLPTAAAQERAPGQRLGEMWGPKQHSMSQASRHKPSTRNCLVVYWAPERGTEAPRSLSRGSWVERAQHSLWLYQRALGDHAR